MPSLLRSLLADPADLGYAAAAERLSGRRRPHDRWWQAAAAVSIATVFGAGVAQARSTAPGLDEERRVLAETVRASQERVGNLDARRDVLAAESDDLARRQLATGQSGRELLARLDALTLSAATTPVSGPGLRVTLTEPAGRADLTDVAAQQRPGTRQVILDRDLQACVNALWAAGAEAVSVGGIRIGPGATLRQAGGAILADNRPIVGPYILEAIGPPGELAESFGRSGALQRLRLLEGGYGVGVRVGNEESLTLPAGAGRELVVAAEPGRPLR